MEKVKAFWDYATELVKNFLKLKWPYWLIQEVDHARLVLFFILIVMLVLGFATLANVSAVTDSTSGFMLASTVLIVTSMAIAYFVHGFIPSPGNDNQGVASDDGKRVKDLAALSLFVCFFALILDELLSTAGIHQLIDFRKSSIITDFVRQYELTLLEPIFHGVVAVSVVVLLMKVRQNFVAPADVPVVDRPRVSERSSFIYTLSLIMLCAICVGLIKHAF